MVFDATAGLREPPRRTLFDRMARNAEPYLYAAPALILIVAVMLVPLVLGLSYAFRDVKLLNPFCGGFVGLDHFRALAGDDNFFRALRNTLWWTGASVFLQFVFGLILALLLERPFRRPRRRAGAGVPALGGADLPHRPQLGLAVQPGRRAAAALALRARHPRRAGQHPVEPAACHVGTDRRQCLVGHPVLRDHAARRAAVDPARPLRGGGDRRRRRGQAVPSITLPFLAPTIAITVLLRTVWIANFADLIIVMTNGGPADRTQIVASYIFTQAFKALDFGYASAIALVLLVLLLAYSMLIVVLRQS